MAKILFLAVNPADTARLRLDEELRQIDGALQMADPSKEDFSIVQWWGVRPNELSALLLRHRPDIVHFSGHGSARSEIVLTDEAGRSLPVSGDALRDLLEILRDNVRCVVLNACFSAGQAEKIAEVVDVVVGMSGAVEDVSAIRFASSFYKALGHGKDVRTAFELASLEMAMLGRSHPSANAAGRDFGSPGSTDERRPRLVTRSNVDPASVKITAGRALGSGSPRSGLPESRRIRAYVELGRLLKPLARYDRPEELTVRGLRKMSAAMRDWYFDRGGWLFLTEAARAPYFDLKESLKKAIEDAGSKQESESVDEHLTVATRHASALRKALRESFSSS